MKTGMLENQIILSKILRNENLYIKKYLRYENGEKEHCLELWNRDGKVILKHVFYF